METGRFYYKVSTWESDGLSVRQACCPRGLYLFSFCHTTDPELMILIRATKGSGENPAQLYTSGKLCANTQPIVFTMYKSQLALDEDVPYGRSH